MHKCAILQSNYIPWKGVFDMINQVDTFVFLEDVQFTKQDWRTRNRIKHQTGLLWLSVPVKNTYSAQSKIYEISILNEQSGFNWQKKHYRSIFMSYAKAPYFKDYQWLLKKIYLEQIWENLSEFNIYVTKLLCKVLNIKTKFINSIDLDINGLKDDKIIRICDKLCVDLYLSGPSAKNYIIQEKFLDSGIQLEYMNYNYPEYKQLYGEFNHYVTVLDVIFNCGSDADKYIFSKIGKARSN